MTTHVTFTIHGSTEADLIQSAETEVERFFDFEEGIPATFFYEINATRDDSRGALTTYTATVTTFR